MANILVNGLKSKAGGGKVILDTYLRLLVESASSDHYFVLTPDRDSYRMLESDRITIIDVPRWAHSNLSALPLYRFVFPRLLKRHAIDAILNFGDIVIPTDVPQVYSFDWAFAVYPEHVRSNRLRPAEAIAYRMKLHFFEAYLHHATIVTAQTQAMSDRLSERYDLDNIVVVPSAVSHAETSNEARIALPPGRRYLIYPANYYPHKNIEILIDVAAALKERGSDIGIVTTLHGEEHPGAAAFLNEVRRRNIDDVLVNVGRLAPDEIPALYRASCGLLMPTLLETFGLPYVEAMQHGRPILTSGRDFSKTVCGDAAVYFDPSDAQSIVSTIEEAFENPDVWRGLVARGRLRLSKMWDWQQVFDEYQHLIEVSQSSATQVVR